jgi:hypothetical protein
MQKKIKNPVERCLRRSKYKVTDKWRKTGGLQFSLLLPNKEMSSLMTSSCRLFVGFYVLRNL